MTAGTTLLVAAGVHTLEPTVDAGAPVRAVAVEGERITWCGAVEDAPPCATTADLGGAWITPAFVDAHVHATATGLAADGVDLAGAGSLADCLDRLRRHAASRGDPVLLGSRWEEFAWPEGRPPTAEEVSAAAPERTVVLTRVDAHACVVDAATLAELPLDDLAGVDRGPDGVPTGLLREAASEAALRHVRRRLGPEQLRRARTRVCAQAAALGIASLHEMGHPGLSGLDDTLAWAQGSWPVEVVVWWADLDVAAARARDLRPGGDLFLDGSIGSRTAAVSCGYADGPGQPALFHDDATVTAFFRAATLARCGAGVHAIGDEAIAQALRALAAVADDLGPAAVRASRHRIEHVELASAEQVQALADLGAVASVQPAFDAAWGGPTGMYASRFGADLACRSNPLRWLLDAGVGMAFGSDTPVTPLDPWGAVAAAERHRGGLGIGRRGAVLAHTRGGRHVAGQDDAGVLAPGARADLAVWDADPLTVDDPRRLRCLATAVRGRCVHGHLPLPAPERT